MTPKLSTDGHTLSMPHFLEYEIRHVYYADSDWRMPREGASLGQRIANMTQQAETTLWMNDQRVRTLFNEGYRNDDIQPVDVRNEEVTRTVVIDVVEPATLWQQVKSTLKERWPRLFSRLAVRRSSRAVTKEVKFTVPVSRNVTVQFIDPFCVPPDGLRSWRRALCGRNEDAEAIITVMRKKAAEHVRSER